MHALVSNLIELLQNHQLVEHVRVVNYDETPAGNLEAKIRCRLIDKYKLQVWLHLTSEYRDYAYQLFTNRPLLRWDNAPHYPTISTAPHHFHDENNTVDSSPLIGDSEQDLKRVLSEIEIWLNKRVISKPD